MDLFVAVAILAVLLALVAAPVKIRAPARTHGLARRLSSTVLPASPPLRPG